MIKFNLEPNPDDYRMGYVNITSNPQISMGLPQDTLVIPGYWWNLDPVAIEPVEEIIFGPFLNIISPSKLPEILVHWREKLSWDGRILLKYIDIRRVAMGIQTDKLDLQTAHNLTIGLQKEYNSVIDTFTIRGMVEQLGFKVDSIVVQEYFGTIELIKLGK